MPLLLHAAPATTTATAPTTRPDPHLWTKRNLELIRDAAQSGKGIGSAVMFSVAFNPLIVRDPYAAQVREIVEAALAKPRGKDAEEMTGALDEAARLLRQPEDERILRQLLGETSRPEKPLVRAAFNKMSELSPARWGKPYQTLFDRVIEQVDAHARETGEWGRLALGYHHLAYDAVDSGDRERANRYIDRMLAILRDHPEFQDPHRGNTNNVAAQGLAELLIKAGRADDLSALEAALDGQPKIDLLIGIPGARARAGDLAAARRVVETQLRPLAPAVADRIAAALSGNLAAASVPVASTAPVSAPTTTSPARRRPTREDPAELRLREALILIAQAVADDHARRGDLDAAARQQLAIYTQQGLYSGPRDTLPSGGWAQLAKLAAEAGHAQTARTAYQRAADALTRQSGEQEADRARLIRDALDRDRLDIVAKAFSIGSLPHPWARYQLSRAYRELGMADRADALAEVALDEAREDDNGHVIAAVAVDRHRGGDVKRAEALLFDAMNHLDGEGFGMGVTGAAVSAAIKMNRLDLLERMYESPERSDTLLLCIIAARAGTFVLDERHDDDDDD